MTWCWYAVKWLSGGGLEGLIAQGWAAVGGSSGNSSTISSIGELRTGWNIGGLWRYTDPVTMVNSRHSWGGVNRACVNDTTD